MSIKFMCYTFLNRLIILIAINNYYIHPILCSNAYKQLLSKREIAEKNVFHEN